MVILAVSQRWSSSFPCLPQRVLDHLVFRLVVRSCSCQTTADVRQTHTMSFTNSWRPHPVKIVRVSDLLNAWAVEWVPLMQSVCHGTYPRNGYGVHGAPFRYVMVYRCDPVTVASAGQPHRSLHHGGPMWASATMGRQSVGYLQGNRGCLYRTPADKLWSVFLHMQVVSGWDVFLFFSSQSNVN